MLIWDHVVWRILVTCNLVHTTNVMLKCNAERQEKCIITMNIKYKSIAMINWRIRNIRLLVADMSRVLLSSVYETISMKIILYNWWTWYIDRLYCRIKVSTASWRYKYLLNWNVFEKSKCRLTISLIMHYFITLPIHYYLRYYIARILWILAWI